MISPIVFTGDSWFQDEMFLTVADQIDPMLSDELYTNKVAWNDPKMVTALTAYQNLYKNGVFDTATLSLKGSAGDDQFNAGKAAFLVEGSWDSSVLSSSYRDANKITVGNVGAGAFPVVVDGGRREGPPPTVVDATLTPIRVLREGALPASFIEGTMLMSTRRKLFSRHKRPPAG